MLPNKAARNAISITEPNTNTDSSTRTAGNDSSDSEIDVSDIMLHAPHPSADSNDEDLTVSLSPYVAERYSRARRLGLLSSNSQLRRVQRVSRHAALTTKQQLWDSNDVGIDAAVAAVDHWENGYKTVRGLVLGGVQNAQALYGGLKEGAGRLEHGILLPVRDWILLPAFVGVERASTETIRFFASPEARELALNATNWARSVPVVGENVLAPSMVFGAQFVQRTWHVVQYPIPRKEQVRDSVDFSLNSTKWALSTAGRHIRLYFQQADANITRTLMHTQWKVLGSGPYATLDKLNKRLVIDHLCERYFHISSAVRRYELAAHIRACNPTLYHDLVLTGMLQQRGGELTVDDEWLSTWPVYRHLEDPFLIPEEPISHTAGTSHPYVGALWFRLNYVNGERPGGRDQRWACFDEQEQFLLEHRYQEILCDGQVLPLENMGREHLATVLQQQQHRDQDEDSQDYGNDMDVTMDMANAADTHADIPATYPTVAKWYVPDVETDALVDEQRHAVTFFSCCPSCRRKDVRAIPPLRQKEYGELCTNCQKEAEHRMPVVNCLLSPPPICAVQRPTFWRFHGPGDELRRATWILDTPRNGKQPFDEAAQTILEDAYLFLKYMSVRQEFDWAELDSATLLTVEVPCPDGTDRLVQFSSLTQATAIQKGILPAAAIFKRRVYRGAWLQQPESTANQKTDQQSVQDSIFQAVQDNGALGETVVPDAPLRSVLTTPSMSAVPTPSESGLVLDRPNNDDDLAVPLDTIWNDQLQPPTKQRAKSVEDGDSNVDHLVLVVHGIGEMMRSIDVFGLAMPNLSSIIDCCGFLRKSHLQVQEAHFSQMYPTVHATSKSNTGRVEYLPVEWHEAFSILSQRGAQKVQYTSSKSVTIKDISLRTIPNMRDFANDTLLDVLYFMSPEHHDMIVSIVADEMNNVVEKFVRLTGFSGRVSVIGHSLGSIISWDILANQGQSVMSTNPNVRSSAGLTGVTSLGSLGSLTDYSGGNAATTASSQENPEVTLPIGSTVRLGIDNYPQLDFDVDNLFLLGSPVAVFLMIRNQRKPLTEDYFLPGCNRVFNIFHPYDPIAYRIEPCIDPRNSDFEPTIMKHWNGGFRVQYQTKRLWKKFMESTWKTQQNVVEAFEASMAGMGLLDTTADCTDDDTIHSEVSSDDNRSTVNVVVGQLNQGRRIDFMLQEREIETANEYVSALAAHSSYWTEKDLSLFVARQIYLSALESAAAEDANTNDAS